MFEQIPKSGVIQRVFAISTSESSMGSALGFSSAGKICYLTAAHVLENLTHAQPSSFSIYQNGIWNEAKATPYFSSGRPYQNGDVDIAVLKTDSPASPAEELPALSCGGMGLGQDLYFLGFPFFGAIDHRPETINSGFPLPFIKKATFSATHGDLIYLDGHNNPGFSGGPVIFWNFEKRRHQIAGIVSAYLPQHNQDESSAQKYHENSGIGIAYKINAASTLLKDVCGIDCLSFG